MRPQTFTDTELFGKIQAFFLDNGRFPTIVEVKRMGCGDERAQTLLRAAKGLPARTLNPGPDVLRNSHTQLEPKLKLEPKPFGSRIKYDEVFDPIIEVNLDAIPKWLALRLIRAVAKK